MIPKNKIKKKMSINFIIVSILFGVAYWIIEAIRDVFIFGKGNLLNRIFITDPIGFWTRILVVFILLLFGIYTQSIRVKLDTHKKIKKEGKYDKTSIIWAGFIFAIAYWVIESIRDFLLHPQNSIFQNILSPNSLSFWTRFLAVCFLLLFCFYTQNLFNEIRKNEENLRLTNRRLKELDQLKSDFLSTVSHELRTPIAIMREGVSLCLNEGVGPLNPTQRKLLTDTQENIDRLNRLVTDLLDLSRIEEGKLTLRRSSVDICSIIDKVKSNYDPQAQKKEIQIITKLPAESLTLFIDEDKVTQIFNNLMSNAIRYSNGKGTVTIEVKDHEDEIECHVSDTGIGISEENINRLFSKFEQVGRLKGSGYKGTGLGLAITKGLVEKHGGKISVQSQIGVGSIFSFTLKKAPVPKILIVDDEEKIIEIIKEFLMEDQYQTVEAKDGNSALKIATSEKPSLIILDMKLPGMNGYEVLGRLKQDQRTQNIPLIIMSAFSIDRERLNSYKNHAVFPIITKPFDRETLRSKIKEILVE